MEKYQVHYVGTDQSSGLLKQAKKEHALEIEQKKASFYCTAHRDKKFPAEYFDLVCMMASFHHLPDKKSRLKVLKKIMKEMIYPGQIKITVIREKRAVNFAK